MAFNTAGTQTVTVTDVSTTSITGGETLTVAQPPPCASMPPPWTQPCKPPPLVVIVNQRPDSAVIFLTWNAGDVDEYVRRMREPGAMTAALNWYRAADVGSIDGLGPITTPTMYVWSTEDIALGREAAEATVAHVEGPYRFEVLEGVSHWVPEEAADALNRLLLDHLSSS